MIKALLSGILAACNQLINLFIGPVDLLIKTAFPTLSDKIEVAVDSITRLFSYIPYALGFLPERFISIIIVIFSIHITFIVLNRSVNAIIKIYTIIQKIKFW